MISYSWDVQQAIFRLRDRLKSKGFKVWIDVENMCKYLLIISFLNSLLQRSNTTIDFACLLTSNSI